MQSDIMHRSVTPEVLDSITNLLGWQMNYFSTMFGLIVVIFTIVIAVVGWFGWKELKSIAEEKINDMVEKKVSERVSSVEERVASVEDVGMSRYSNAGSFASMKEETPIDGFNISKL